MPDSSQTRAACPCRSINAQKDVTRFAEGVRRGFHTRKSIRRNHFRRSMFEVESYCKVGAARGGAPAGRGFPRGVLWGGGGMGVFLPDARVVVSPSSPQFLVLLISCLPRCALLGPCPVGRATLNKPSYKPFPNVPARSPAPCLPPQEGELPPGMVPQHGDEEEEEGQEERVDPASKGGKAAGKAAGKATSTKRKSGAAAAVAAALTSAAAGGGAVLQPNRQLRVLSLGRVEWLHPAFHDEKHIWPVGYTAERLAVTPASGGREVPHLMEVLEASDGSGPLFRWVLLLLTPTGDGSRALQ